MLTTRLIKKYTNRKMYDTVQKEYVNLVDLETLVRDNIDVMVIDNDTKQNITGETLLQVFANNPMNALDVTQIVKLIRRK